MIPFIAEILCQECIPLPKNSRYLLKKIVGKGSGLKPFLVGNGPLFLGG